MGRAVWWENSQGILRPAAVARPRGFPLPRPKPGYLCRVRHFRYTADLSVSLPSGKVPAVYIGVD